MFSVLIPIYNYNISRLIQSIYYQLEKECNFFEIILVDDCSTKHKYENKKFVENKQNIVYIELKENIGRARIRNYLADKARYENLIFLDCDVIVNENFVLNYKKHIDKDIVCGGIDYLKQKPTEDYILHWKYGLIKEKKAQKKKKFFSSNFLIKKKIFKQIKFDEKISVYGHEDTVFAISLKKLNYKIDFIENPVYHLGLDTNEQFLKKTENWIKNSPQLIEKYGQDIINEIRLYKFYFKISKYKLDSLLILLYKLFLKTIKKKLFNKNPKIFFLDIYKLLFLAKILKTNE